MRVRDTLVRLQDTTAQIRVRGAMVLLIAFAAVAERLGLEVILGAFAAGAVLTLVDDDRVMTHPEFRRKLEAIGFGLFIPVFFVATGVRFDLDALLGSGSTLLMVPVFLAALLVVRGLPALLYRSVLAGREVAAAGLLQATSLPFIVAATAIGLDLGLIDAAESAALVGAGLLSVVLFPLIALALLQPSGGQAEAGGGSAVDSSTITPSAPRAHFTLLAWTTGASVVSRDEAPTVKRYRLRPLTRRIVTTSNVSARAPLIRSLFGLPLPVSVASTLPRLPSAFTRGKRKRFAGCRPVDDERRPLRAQRGLERARDPLGGRGEDVGMAIVFGGAAHDSAWVMSLNTLCSVTASTFGK